MVAPLRYVNISELVGSWPIVPNFLPSGTPTLLPDTMLTKATILGVQQETSAGYDVGTKSFHLYVDNESVWTTVTFSGTGARTLDQVITDINTQVGSTVAFRDNGFLRLESPTSGSTSYLRVASASTASDVLYVLGLFPDTISRAGYLNPARHPDPTRQVSLPGQLTLAEGEGFSTKAFNRALFQLGVNVERSEGLLSRKRVASRKEIALHTYSAPAFGDGYQFSGDTFVYTGDQPSPSSEELEKLFVVLDSDGRELVKEFKDFIANVTCYFHTNPETGQQQVTSLSAAFTASQPKEDIYITANGTGVPAAMALVPMKITGYIDANNAIISPIDPTTGESTPFTAGGPGNWRVGVLYEVTTTKCVVEEVKASALGIRVENRQELIYNTTLTSSARVDLNNRLVIPGAGFNSLSPSIDVGNKLYWSGHAVTSPFSNTGYYRVSAVIDDETLELVGEDWGPVHLNPDLYSAAPGSIWVRTDGRFWKDPFIKFKEAPDGAIPEDGVDEIRILYLGGTTIREASDDPTAFGRGLEFQQEADETVQRAILAMVGPSVTTIDEYLHGDRRKNLEDLDYRLNFEHYAHDEAHSSDPDTEVTGKHRDIRPDTIDMYPETTGQTVTIRSGTSEGGATVKVGLLNKDEQQVFEITSGGPMYVRDGVSPTTDYTLVSDGRVYCYTSGNDSIVQSESATGTARINCFGTGAGADAIAQVTSTLANARLYVTASTGIGSVVVNGAGDAHFNANATTGDAYVNLNVSSSGTAHLTGTTVSGAAYIDLNSNNGNVYVDLTSTGTANAYTKIHNNGTGDAYLDIDATAGGKAYIDIDNALGESYITVDSNDGPARVIVSSNGANEHAYLEAYVNTSGNVYLSGYCYGGTANLTVQVGTGVGDFNANANIVSYSGTASKSVLKLASTQLYNGEGVGDDNFGQVIKFIGDVNGDVYPGQAPQFNIGSKFGGSDSRVMAFDWINDGAGNVHRGLRMGSRGANALGTNLWDSATQWAQFVLSGSSTHPRVWTYLGKTYGPHFVLEASNNDTGFVYRSSEDVADSSEEAAFLGIFGRDDSVNNDDRTWKFIKLLSEDPSIERFAVNKYGQVYCGLTAVDQASQLALLGDDDLLDEVGLWSRGHVIVGTLANWAKFPSGAYADSGTMLWLVGGPGYSETPYGIASGIDHSDASKIRQADMLNCWYDGTSWRYVNANDYAVRRMTWAAAPGTSSYGHTTWSAAPGRTGGSAGDLIATGYETGSWVHALRWTHDNGYIGLGSVGYTPSSLLHLHENGNNAQLHIEQDANADCGIYIEATNANPDPYIHIAAGGDTFGIGVDNSAARLQLTPGPTFDGTTGLVMGTHSNIGINTDAFSTWDLRVGGDGSAGSLWTSGHIRCGGNVSATYVRVADIDRLEFGDYSAASTKFFYTYVSPMFVCAASNTSAIGGTDRAFHAYDYSAMEMRVSNTNDNNTAYFVCPIPIPQRFSDLRLDSVVLWVHQRGHGASPWDEIHWRMWVRRRAYNSRSWTNILSSTYVDSTGTTSDGTDDAYASSINHYIVGGALDSPAGELYYLRFVCADDSGNPAQGNITPAVDYASILGIRCGWTASGFRPGFSF